MIRQCSILFGCLALGELIVYLTGIKLPSSIIGMLLLTLFLQLGWIKLEWVHKFSGSKFRIFLCAVRSGVDALFRCDYGAVLADCNCDAGQHDFGFSSNRLGTSISS